LQLDYQQPGIKTTKAPHKKSRSIDKPYQAFGHGDEQQSAFLTPEMQSRKMHLRRSQWWLRDRSAAACEELAHCGSLLGWWDMVERIRARQ
jgi:hypothetical protein